MSQHKMLYAVRFRPSMLDITSISSCVFDASSETWTCSDKWGKLLIHDSDVGIHTMRGDIVCITGDMESAGRWSSNVKEAIERLKDCLGIDVKR